MIQILLIEDDDADHTLFMHSVRGFRPPPPHITRVSDLDSALTLMAALDYDLILADLGLPDETPQTILDSVLSRAKDAAVVILSGRGSYDLLQLALVSEADGALSKQDPLGPRELESYLLQAIHRKRETVKARKEHAILKEDHRRLKRDHEALRAEFAELRENLARLEGREEAHSAMFKWTKWKVGAFIGIVTALSTLAGALAGLL